MKKVLLDVLTNSSLSNADTLEYELSKSATAGLPWITGAE